MMMLEQAVKDAMMARPGCTTIRVGRTCVQRREGELQTAMCEYCTALVQRMEATGRKLCPCPCDRCGNGQDPHGVDECHYGITPGGPIKPETIEASRGRGKKGRIKALRMVYPRLGLKEAKDLIDADEAALDYAEVTENLTAGAAPAGFAVAFIHITDEDGNVVGTIDVDRPMYKMLTTSRAVAPTLARARVTAEIVSILSEVKVP